MIPWPMTLVFDDTTETAQWSLSDIGGQRVGWSYAAGRVTSPARETLVLPSDQLITILASLWAWVAEVRVRYLGTPTPEEEAAYAVAVNSIEIEHEPSRVKFKCRLEGLTLKATEDLAANTITFTELPSLDWPFVRLEALRRAMTLWDVERRIRR